MIYIVSGTNRLGSNTLKVSQIVQRYFNNISVESIIINLADLPFETLHTANYGKNLPPKIADAIQSLNKADGIFFVTPEYNGSFPGILKYFIDHFSYPETFEHRPVAFVGLGGRWGGLRPVEHLQAVFGYRNAYVFPQRVFISNVWDVVKDEEIKDTTIEGLLKTQVAGFAKFIAALKSEKLDANSLRK